jgi:hypothetical protein
MKTIDVTDTIEEIMEQMQECEQRSLHGIFLRMMIKRAILAEMQFCKRVETMDKNIWEWYYEPPKGASYFLMRVRIEVGKVFMMHIDYNPALVVNNEL